MAITINDIARMAGVSRATVSRALNKGYVSTEARERIDKVIRETGYMPHVEAKALRSGKSNVIGVVLAFWDNGFITGIIDALQARLEEKASYSLLFIRSGENDGKIREAIRYFTARRVDGIVVMNYVVDAETEQMMRSSDVPIVYFGVLPVGAPSVCLDDYTSFKTMTQYLIGKGYTDIGFFGKRLEPSVNEMRHKAILDAHREAHLPFRDENFFFFEDTQPEKAAILAGADKLLASGHVPRALLCDFDDVAACLYGKLHSAGLRIPEDTALIGMGNTPICEFLTPELTSLNINAGETGRVMAELLLKQIQGGEADRVTTIKPFVAERGSTGS